jgi:hypothetical protein
MYIYIYMYKYKIIYKYSLDIFVHSQTVLPRLDSTVLNSELPVFRKKSPLRSVALETCRRLPATSGPWPTVLRVTKGQQNPQESETTENLSDHGNARFWSCCFNKFSGVHHCPTKININTINESTPWPADLHHALLVVPVASEGPNPHRCRRPTPPRRGRHGSEAGARPGPLDWGRCCTSEIETNLGTANAMGSHNKLVGNPFMIFHDVDLNRFNHRS